MLSAAGALGCNDQYDLQLETSAGDTFVNSNPPHETGYVVTPLHMPVDGTTVRYGSLEGGRSQDTLIFVDDPSIAWLGGEGSELPPKSSRGVGVAWTDDCGGGTCSQRSYSSLDLSCSHWGAAACATTLTTKAVFTWDRGACSKRTALSGVLQQLVTTAVDGMKQSVADADPGLANTESHQYAHAQTAIWANGSTAEGGFQANLNMDVHTTGMTWWTVIPVAFNYDASANVSARYRFALFGGVLGVDVLATNTISADDDTDLYGLFNWSKPISGQLVSGLADTVPSKIQDQARALQTQVIPTSKDGGYSVCPTVSACPHSDARALLSFGLIGAVNAKIITGALANQLSPLLDDPSQWSCEPLDPSAKESPNVCKMLVRAQRVNVYPDAVELVFREAGGYPIRRESILEAVLRAGGDASSMCDDSTVSYTIVKGFQRTDASGVYD